VFVLFAAAVQGRVSGMSRVKSAERALVTNKEEDPAKDAARMLAQAEKLIAKLQSKVADQGQIIREFRSQAKLADNITAEISGLKAEVTDLSDEVRELTRANREHVTKNEALLAENAKLKAEAKARTPHLRNARANLPRLHTAR
jgi:FtsZ-binding cell division protein ZapB